MDTVRFLVSGRVQGVFYRASTREQAVRLGLAGYAKNLADGRVEVVACGELEALEALERWLWQGPPAAEITQVVRNHLAAQSLQGFLVL